MRVYESSMLNTDALSYSEQLWAYNGLDCMVTFEVFEVLKGKIPEVLFAYDMMRTMQGPAFTLMHRGVAIDMQMREVVLKSLQEQRLRCLDIFTRICHEGLDIALYHDKDKGRLFAINPASSQQLCNLFYDVLGLPPIKAYNKTTKDYSVTCNRKALEKLQRDLKAKPFCELILAIRDFDKKIQVLQSGIEKGRMHTAYQVAGPMTGRWSSNEDPFGRGTNLQNITDEMRRVFVPDTGKKFCQLDLAQAESMLVAHLALPWGDSYLRACKSGDLHTAVTKLVWRHLPWGSEPDKEIAKRPFYRHFSYRDMAKRGGHGTNYGGTAAVIAQHLNIPTAQAREFQDAYFAAFPEIPKWHNAVRVALATTRSIVTPLGRRCFFPGRPWDSDTIKSAIAYGPQGTIGDVLNLGFYNVWRKYDQLNGGAAAPIQILTQVHDSILFQYDAKDEPWLLPLIKDNLKVTVEINKQPCSIEVDIQVGWNWGKYIEKRDADGTVRVINPLGLKDWKGSDERSYDASTARGTGQTEGAQL